MTEAQMIALVTKLLGSSKKTVKRAKKPVKQAVLKGSDFEAALIAACVKHGYASPVPRENILTYNRWVEKGRKVRSGEKSITVAGRKTALFHEAQTDVVAQTV